MRVKGKAKRNGTRTETRRRAHAGVAASIVAATTLVGAADVTPVSAGCLPETLYVNESVSSEITQPLTQISWANWTQGTMAIQKSYSANVGFTGTVNGSATASTGGGIGLLLGKVEGTIGASLSMSISAGASVTGTVNAPPASSGIFVFGWGTRDIEADKYYVRSNCSYEYQGRPTINASTGLMFAAYQDK